MDNLIDIKKIWLSANTKDLPLAQDVIRSIKKFRVKQTVKVLGLILLSLILFATMVDVVFFYHSVMISTRIGEALIIIAIMIILSMNIWEAINLQSGKTFNNNDFLQYLRKMQQRQIFFTKRVQRSGFAISSIGLLLYIFEKVHTETITMILAYSLTIGWILFCWFFVRPYATRKKTGKLAATIKRFESLSQQLLNN